jgi:ATP-dependent RNA/DNA helicase IGHMBP2
LDLFFPFELPLPGLYTREVEYSNSKLNELQNEAVQHCIGETVHLLHGPPGTGKTTTVCEVIVEAVRRK